MNRAGVRAAADGASLPKHAWPVDIRRPPGPHVAAGHRPARTAQGAERPALAGVVRAAPPAHARRRVRRRSIIIAELVGIDLAAGALAVAAAFVMRFGLPDSHQRAADLVAAALLPVLWIGAVALNRGYDLRFVAVGGGEFGNLVRAFMHLTVVTAFVSFAAKLDLARGFVMPALPLALLLSCAGRYVARLRVQRMRRTGRALHRVLAVGAKDSILQLAGSMRRDASAGLRIVGACLPDCELGDPAAREELTAEGVTVCGPYSAAAQAVGKCGAASVAVVAGDVGTQKLRSISWALEGADADLIVCSGLAEVVDGRVHVQSVAGLPLLRVDAPKFRGFRCVLKSGFDRVTAAIAILILSPLMAVIALLVMTTSPGGALYSQERIGRRGRPFRMYKFRTMHAGADAGVDELADRNAADGLLFKIREDPRVTRLGRLLRRYSLDELPQLFNVVTGSMSLVGPRPPLPREVARYDADLHRRLLVRPGLTGLWQVSGRSDLPWDEAVRLDLHYVENWSLGLDMVVLLKTAGAVVRATGAY